MTAKIDIKHPSGRSLEGFPYESSAPKETILDVAGDFFDAINEGLIKSYNLSPGDTITIEIL